MGSPLRGAIFESFVAAELTLWRAMPADNLRWWAKLARIHTGVVIHGGIAAHSLHGFAIRPWFIA